LAGDRGDDRDGEGHAGGDEAPRGAGPESRRGSLLRRARRTPGGAAEDGRRHAKETGHGADGKAARQHDRGLAGARGGPRQDADSDQAASPEVQVSTRGAGRSGGDGAEAGGSAGGFVDAVMSRSLLSSNASGGH